LNNNKRELSGLDCESALDCNWNREYNKKKERKSKGSERKNRKIARQVKGIF